MSDSISTCDKCKPRCVAGRRTSEYLTPHIQSQEASGMSGSDRVDKNVDFHPQITFTGLFVVCLLYTRLPVFGEVDHQHTSRQNCIRDLISATVQVYAPQPLPLSHATLVSDAENEASPPPCSVQEMYAPCWFRIILLIDHCVWCVPHGVVLCCL